MPTSQATRNERKANGICIQCGKAPAETTQRCEPCRELKRTYNAKWQSLNKDYVADHARTVQANKSTDRKELDRQKAMARRYIKKNILRTNDLCTGCGKQPPIPGKATCEPCRVRRERSKPKQKVSSKAWRMKNKLMALAAYGTICQCCTEADQFFLTIDHINNDGHIHRKQADVNGSAIYWWLIKNDFPPGFQVLCFNCNQGKRINKGVCPHQTRATALAEAA